MTKTAVIIVAAGRGTRAGGTLPKQWQTLGGGRTSLRVIDHSIARFRAHADAIVVVHHPDDQDLAQSLENVTLVSGGATRAASARAGLEALVGQGIDTVLIHDAARALIPSAVIEGVKDALEQHQGAAPALPVTDALWRGAAPQNATETSNFVDGTQDRSGLFRAQTPQGFDFEAILTAHRAHHAEAADDVEVARAAGIRVAITQGSEENFKITHPEDFARASALLRQKEQETTQMDIRLDMRLGNGYDVHRFGEGDHVWLCGVKVPHGRSLQGHSDADVGMHALTDAIYGALARGDIGQHFPPSDPQWKGAESHIFLRHAIGLAREMGYELMNCDVTLVCERPKVGPHAQAMRAALAEIMSVDIEKVSVKATTSERLGFTGREEGIASLATAALIRT
ncbi:bifunctional 2-C-methyl-D-erythritol 4-phosphate cytidylyltransferase/2-C-methyl-D-erythritol 2,4-cyclodiphosphate synthase [Celeribacter sp. PS-C1]|uniref:bifunctional 2-C-methyl-D-erythritol 4-phosphate cytidylyltransferase/2-C-methyl-D-erythritol 2,4-cyclodiphosphate synthase n=1 Tax=Celeribacter sp. PS-C1 TaxID=2820813 RepID=UPI001CA4755B|nr:bifunctional 2-C-methyl-D-erythritol 4-phosphate cytidylyltransferase/2-C-methyl-D-erythritol 2,4-cyclodiphosphate synthase [Celeribacter sp. PS-C1]MBW6417462.1 bifunctional 2-C-methyl-D-erythritol 4-phosphate cytidylyltransferase/2-C-methyl-D-erythritol 2,4-cyclodiphosphate synthase [Celeribacter sp. PS-C1]